MTASTRCAEAVRRTHIAAAAQAHDAYVQASWQRCLQDYRLRPEVAHEPPRAPEHRLSESRDALHRLLRIARSEMQNFYTQIGHSNNTLVLTDASGLVLEQLCDPRQARVFRSVGLVPGFLWDEPHAGTNGPGTCLLEGRALTVYRDEHFFRNFSNLSCSAAPIRDPSGKLLAVLDVSCFDCTDSRQSQMQTMLLVSSSARAIEKMYFASSMADSWIVRFHNRAEFVGMMRDGLLAVDGDGRVCGADAMAAGMLGQERAADLLGRDIEQLFELNAERLHAQAHEMPCRVWSARGLAPGSHYFLSVRPPLQARGKVVPRAAPPTAIEAPRPTTAIGANLEATGERDPAMAFNIWCAEQVMDKRINILLQGETGTGKGTLAKAIHQRSSRARNPFIAMCCAAIPETLAESELFGYAAGAFTGARSGGMRGKILASHGGTLFLDEIGDMPLSLQARLLHVLEEREVTPLGSTKAIPVDLHIVSASNHDLPELIHKGLFREDLYYRLNGITLGLPPLRERQDLRELIATVCVSENDERPAGITPQAMECLLAYAWPGNIRELRNVVRTALALSSDATVHLEHLPPAMRRAVGAAAGDIAPGLPAPAAMAAAGASAAEPGSAQILALLQQHRWNISHAAQALGVSRNTLYRRMHRLGILTPRSK
jgi:transcriptional regulator of acetoin/glycerol metabolism